MINEDFMKKRTGAFSLAEVVTVFIIMGIVAVWAAKVALLENPKQFITKYDKISSRITKNIKNDEKNYLKLSESKNYKETSGIMKNIFIGRMKATKCNYAKGILPVGNINTENYCWANKINNLNNEIMQSMKNGDYAFYSFKDGSVAAVQNDNNGLKIFIDVNGLNGPNEFGKDVIEYKY